MGTARVPELLLIDNTLREGGKISPRVLRLERILRSFPSNVRTIHFPDLSGRILQERATDGIVLSGSGLNMSDPSDRGRMGTETDIIRDVDIPVLGICFGFHLLLHSFGCTVKRNQSSNEFLLPNGRDITIQVTGDEGGILGNGPHPVNVSHRDYVEPSDPALLRGFSVHSESRDGPFRYLQYARHRKRPLHAVQFHPEAYEGAPEEVQRTGGMVLHNFIRTLYL